jgi:hypothetical protein
MGNTLSSGDISKEVTARAAVGILQAHSKGEKLDLLGDDYIKWRDRKEEVEERMQWLAVSRTRNAVVSFILCMKSLGLLTKDTRTLVAQQIWSMRTNTATWVNWLS